LKLLYVAGTYAPGAFSGSELSAHTLLRQLISQFDVEVLVVTDAKYTDGHGQRRTYDGIPVHGAEHERRVQEISAVAARFAPDAILTQLLWSDVALDVGRKLDIPTILRIAAVPSAIDLSLPTEIVASSLYAQEWVRKEWDRESYLIYPSIDLARVTARESSETPRFITMFNPVQVKGGSVFREIALALPERQFAVVPGWHSLRDPSGGFDRALIRRSWESQGVANGSAQRTGEWLKQLFESIRIRLGRARGLLKGPVDLVRARLGIALRLPESHYPSEVDFSDLANVTLLEPRAEVDEIYARTRILLVPSQWEETFGRVAIEAFANGIPVVGSSVGGLKEHVGEGGILIDDKANVGAWVEAIEALDSPERYEEFRQRGRDFASRRYSLEETATRFASLLERVATSRRSGPAPKPNHIPATSSSSRVLVLIPYFGKWPPWMGLFLESCRRNPSIDWLLPTDCGPLDANAPDNVRTIATSLEEFLHLASNRLGIEIGWNEPYKICDLRLGLGTIFRDHVADYDFFGWGDIDVIYGNLRKFLTHDVLDHDIVSFCADHLSGHLCLLRNDARVRECYREFEGWRPKMEGSEYVHLDEPPTATIPLSYRVHAVESFNTPLSPFIRWTDGTFDFPTEWYWRDGILTNDKDEDREFPYLHFMHWKGGAWPRECGNAQWERLGEIIHVEAGRARDGFRINAQGFFP